MAREIKIAEKISLSFGKARILPDGEVGTVVIRQSDREIVLTAEQARSLAKQIRARFD